MEVHSPSQSVDFTLEDRMISLKGSFRVSMERAMQRNWFFPIDQAMLRQKLPINKDNRSVTWDYDLWESNASFLGIRYWKDGPTELNPWFQSDILDVYLSSRGIRGVPQPEQLVFLTWEGLGSLRYILDFIEEYAFMKKSDSWY